MTDVVVPQPFSGVTGRARLVVRAASPRPAACSGGVAQPDRPQRAHATSASHQPLPPHYLDLPRRLQPVSAAAQQQQATPAAPAGAAPQASDVVRRFYDAYNTRDLDTISTLIADDISYQ